ncbi:MAG: GTP cyclohydrolase II, partial [Halothiobacillaceae bacterium]
DTPTVVRVHVHDPLCDLLSVRSEACGWPLADALGRLADFDAGVLVLLRPATDERALVRRVRAWSVGLPRQEGEAADDLRTYGVGAQILQDLGVRRMRVMSAPKRFHGLAGFGLEVVDYIHD